MPDGTVVTTPTARSSSTSWAPGTDFVAASGRGGLGNAALASARRRAPGFALLGEPGEARDLVLELKSIADVGLVGFPSAGKSSLVAAMSAARPKIADYPFTTLVPNLGVVDAGEVRYTVADVPGLIEGASEGRGLGHEFLRHVERCAVLVHVIDCATLEPGRDPGSDLDVIEGELAAHGGLEDRPRIVVLNKVDVPEARELADLVRPDLESRGLPVHLVSAATREGLRGLTYALADLVAAARAAAPPPEPTRIVLRPTAVDDGGLHRAPGGHRPRPRGEARALGPPDRLQQRRGGRLPRRPARAARRRGGAPRAGRAARRRRAHRAPGRRRRLRLQARPRRRRRDLARRGEDSRFDESRPAARRRREIQEGLEERAEGETRPTSPGACADPARGGASGPSAYEIGGADDPDWAEQDPDA